ncbi:MAG: hypothetical protein COW01_11390 [Bdellovibrionales bacterium CG12_big_fil_rev_8_21_14_0_65_38_15]|nr:MAG: hypothetical protein COW79_11420 [Bdellovibrionales bacterium CG22_combo_CG10-13_8_21_14_all_38_13]PIQ54214.1 MAG: hypothetical protein COW01_11390 [Bdellovibrionales bacterium CG12_big_fil_rev_8_21_14_0_65_38_15]PIR29272.1 MAG: hypothetical protein COV38_11035 [Bdellovibrionales bacterium CG11_big_fil_rev_8_21_14_0_20_38_13]
MTVRSFKHIGQFVKDGRIKHPQLYSQNQLSKLLGYKNGQFISNVERGLCGIPLKGIQKLIEVLNLDSRDLKNAMLRDYEDTIDSFLNATPSSSQDKSISNGISEQSQL